MQENNEVVNKVIPMLPLLCLLLGMRLILRLVFTSNMRRGSKALFFRLAKKPLLLVVMLMSQSKPALIE